MRDPDGTGTETRTEYQVINSAWTPSFYGYDGFGSVRQLTNTSGAITDTYEYDAFGNLLNKTGTTPNNYLYRGEQYDSDLGLYYLRTRYYNPLTGRFMSRDPNEDKLYDANGNPIDPQVLHKYLYANGDPVNGIDPTGRGVVEDAVARVKFYVRQQFVATKVGISVGCYIDFLSDVVGNIRININNWFLPTYGLADAYKNLRACLSFASSL